MRPDPTSPFTVNVGRYPLYVRVLICKMVMTEPTSEAVLRDEGTTEVCGRGPGTWRAPARMVVVMRYCQLVDPALLEGGPQPPGLSYPPPHRGEGAAWLPFYLGMEDHTQTFSLQGLLPGTEYVSVRPVWLIFFLASGSSTV